jgi:hypothetical protein
MDPPQSREGGIMSYAATRWHRRVRSAPGFHALAAEFLAARATRWAHASGTIRNAARRRWISRHCAELRARAARHRSQIGAPVPSEIARLAAQARHAHACMRSAMTESDRREWSTRHENLMNRSA